MAVSNKKATFAADVKEVWDVVVSLTEYSWRSDVADIQVLKPGKQFIEHTKDGFSTTFTITAFEPCRRYEFDMENANMKGHWVGLFSSEGGKTTVNFTENVTAKKALLKPFVKGYLKKQQAAYFADLGKRLEGDPTSL